MERVENRAIGAFCALLVATLVLPLLGAPAATGPGSRCTRRCGKIDIPYPFGVEPGCYQAAGFNLTCSHVHHPPKLFLGDGTVQVLEISVPDGTVRINSTTPVQEDELWGVEPFFPGNVINGTWGDGLPKDGPFFLSESTNILQVIGCNIQVDLWQRVGGCLGSLVGSCTALCPVLSPKDSTVFPYPFMPNGSCGGLGCCEADIIMGYSSYSIQVRQRSDSDSYSPFSLSNSGIYIVDRNFTNDEITLVDRNFTFHEKTLVDRNFTVDEKTPRLDGAATLNWLISSSKCPRNTSAPECRSANSFCRDYVSHSGTLGYLCLCSNGYQGNPYILDGCQDIDECKSPDVYLCYGNCTNTPGTYTCQCPTGFIGNASLPNGCKDIDECEHQEAYSCYGICLNFPGNFHCQCPNEENGNPFTKGGCISIKRSFTGLSIGLGVGGGATLLLLALAGPFIMHKIKMRKIERVKHKFFNQNHGLLLQQLISRKADIGERMIISLRDLEKATNNFDRARVVGGGGHGVVFKGILNLNVVAIKKAKMAVQKEIDEFINEVAVLSQVNHKNVVKLLGCCLETEVPLLVYEFISNGTLYHHLHVEGELSLPWSERMRIAMEVARAVSYLHSAASLPIFHRDIKSSNILLDDTLTAKVSDFGASRYIPIDRTGVTTTVQGTIGYLDPMYYYTGRLTDKSDVFSFGVLLVELLTRKKPFVYRSSDGHGLVSHFVSELAEGKLIDIIDPQVMEEEDGEVQEVATLAARCTNLKGEDRPTMREVDITLQNLLVKKKQVPFIIATRRNDEDGTLIQHMSMKQIVNDSSRQYTMEEEILLSASYPR